MRNQKLEMAEKNKFKRRWRRHLWRFNRLNPSDSLTISTKQGRFKIRNAYRDAVSQSLYVEREFEQDMMDEYFELADKIGGSKSSERGTILDIGANTGIISVAMLNDYGFQNAIAIEPDPLNFAFLEANMALNGHSEKVTGINKAVSDAKTKLTFELSEVNHGDHRIRKEVSNRSDDLHNEVNRKTIEVAGDTLDNLLSEIDPKVVDGISLVWIDVQGHEGYVFKGAKEFLKRKIPLVSEIWPYGVKRSGMEVAEFCEIIKSNWSTFWVRRRRGYIQYPIDYFDYFFQELDYGDDHDNVFLM